LAVTIFQFAPSAIKALLGGFEQLRKVSQPMCEESRFMKLKHLFAAEIYAAQSVQQ